VLPRAVFVLAYGQAMVLIRPPGVVGCCVFFHLGHLWLGWLVSLTQLAMKFCFICFQKKKKINVNTPTDQEDLSG